MCARARSLPTTHQVECDHLHSGLGFLTQHGALTHSLEVSLQAVLPSLAMPYWDYSIEGEATYLSSQNGDPEPMAIFYGSEVKN